MNRKPKSGPNTPTVDASVLIAEADAEVARVKKALREHAGGETALAVERDDANAALGRALAADRLGEADADAVVQARQRVDRNAAAISDFFSTRQALDQRLSEAKRNAVGVLASNVTGYARELAAVGRSANAREAAARAELEAVAEERRRLTLLWVRVEKATGRRYADNPQDSRQFVFTPDGTPRERGAAQNVA
jgi:hypothetical protein